MDVEQALALVDSLLEGQKLKDVQEQVFRYAWSGWTYPEIAAQIGYDTGHTRDVGSKLWQRLSQAIGEQVSKKNLQAVLRRQSIRKPNGFESSPLMRGTEVETIIQSIAMPEGQKFVRARVNQATPLAERPLEWFSGEAGRHWEEAIDVSVFYGRAAELTLLKKWLLHDGCRLITVLGMGGMGKTTLVTKLAQLLHAEFDVVIWQSLRNAPAITDMLADIIQQLPHQSCTTVSISLEAQLTRMMAGLRACRCLLVLDNFDAVLSSQAGCYREGYEAYGELLRRIGGEHHASHLLLTSREQPKMLAMLEGETLPIRSLRLPGLAVMEIQTICQTNGCIACADEDWHTLARQYSGNPLAIKIVSTVVRDLFNGQLTHFLQQGAIAFGDIRLLLDEQFQRLSNLEQHIIYWLAINREWVSLDQLRSALVPVCSDVALLEALLSLWQRSLIERQEGRFTLQPVVMEYVTEQLLDRVFEEIKQGQLDLENWVKFDCPALPLLCTHALIQAQTEDYLRDSQIRMILVPLATRLKAYFHSLHHLESHLRGVLASLRDHSLEAAYASGNLINLLHHLGLSLKGYDFSHLSIRQACFQGVDLHHTNFAGAQFSESVFTETLAIPLAVAFSPTGDYLASGDLSSEVRLWRVTDGENVWIGKGHRGWVWSIAFSPEGNLLASGSEDCTVKLWNLDTGNCCQTLEGHPSPIWCVAFSPDGQLLASSSEDWTIKLWNVHTGHCLTTLKGHQNWVRSVAFCPLSPTLQGQGGRAMLASAGDDQMIKLWDLKTGQCYRTLNGHSDRVWAIAFSPNGRLLASGSSDQSVRLWDVKTGNCLKILYGHESWVRSIAFSADGQTVVSGSEDRTIRLWDWQTGTCRQILSGHTSWVRSVSLHPNTSLIASGSGDHTIKLWEGDSGRCCRTLTGCTNRVWAIAPVLQPESTDSRLASSHDDHCVRLWKLSNGQCEYTLRGHTNTVCTLAVSPVAPLLASGSADCTIKLWNGQGHCLATLRDHVSRVWSVAFSPDGAWLASSSDDQTVKLWQIATRQCVQTLRGHTSWVCSVAFSPTPPNGTEVLLASGGYDQTVRLWNGTTGDCLQILEGHTNWVWTVAFSPDGQTLASGSGDHTIRLWRVKTGTCYQTLHGHSSRIWSIAFSANGQWLASASTDQTIRLWEVESGACFQILQGHTNVVTSVAFSPSGHLISSSQDETIKLWEIATGQCLNTLKADRPYEGMNITEASGLTDPQKTSLRVLGAIER